MPSPPWRGQCEVALAPGMCSFTLCHPDFYHASAVRFAVSFAVRLAISFAVNLTTVLRLSFAVNFAVKFRG